MKLRWLMLMLALGCGSQAMPLARIGSSPEAQTAFASLQRQWDSKERLDARELEDRLRRYASQYSGDPLVPVVHAYLAILLAEQARASEATALVNLYAREPPGSTRDLFDVVKAYVLRRGGHAPEALALLQPLAGKLIDGAARALLLEELALSALEAHADYEAIGYFDAWLVGTSGPDHERARARVQELIVRLPRIVLESSYQAMRKSDASITGKSAGYSKEMRALVAERLSQIAVDEGDTTLARWLLDPNAGPTPSSLQLQAGLGELAQSSRGTRAVDGRAVGVLLPSPAQGRMTEVADVLRGLSFALGLPDPKGTTRLVIRESGEQVRQIQESLEELAGEGVAIVVAGFDPDTAGRALAWGDAANIAVVSLVPPALERTLRHGFIAGTDVAPQLAALEAAWVKRPASQRQVLFLTGTRVADKELAETQDAPIELAHPCDDPLDEIVRETKTSGYWVSGAVSCTNNLLRQLVRIGKERGGAHDIALGTTLESYDPLPPTGVRLTQMTIASGILPVDAKHLSAEVQRYNTRYGLLPDYWTALGRDIGALAAQAMKTLPENRTTTDQEVYMRRALVEASLLAAQADLWSTDARGFASARVLAREVRVVTLGK